MKKSRLLSLLLAVIMIVSSLPIVATSVSAAETNLLANATISTNIPTATNGGAQLGMRDRDVNSAVGGYLHLGARTAAKDGLGYNFKTTFEAGKTYFLSFDARAAVSYQVSQSNTWPGGRMRLFVAGNVAQSGRSDTTFKYWELSRLKGYGLGITDKNTNTSNTADNPFAVMVANDYLTTTTNYHIVNDHSATQVAVMVTDYRGDWGNAEWRNYEIMLPKVTATVTDPYIAFFGDANDAGPIEIDNIRLYTREGDSKAGAIQKPNGAFLEEITFATAPTIITSGATNTKGAFFVTDGISRPSAASNAASISWVSSAKAFKEVAFNAANADNTTYVPANPSVTYTVNNTALTAGIYELTGEFRDGWHKGATFYKNMKLTPTITYANGTQTFTATQLSTEWTPVTYRFVVDSAKTLSSITFASNVKETVQFRDISLVKVGEYSVKNDAIESGVLADATKSYTTVDAEYDIDDIGSDGKAVKNGYLTVGKLPWYNAGGTDVWGSNFNMFTVTLDKQFESGVPYGIKFSARNSVATSQNARVRVWIGCDNATANWSSWQNFSGDWVDYSYTIAADTSSASDKVNSAWIGKNIKFLLRRGDGPFDIPVDIDNVVIWKDLNSNKVLDANETVLYKENFNNPSANFIGTGTKQYSTIISTPNSVGTAKLLHSFDDNYGVVNSGDYSLSYTGLNVASGIFEFSADLRIPYHKYIASRKNDGNIAWSSAGNTAADIELAKTWHSSNDHDATLVFTLKKGNDTKTHTVTLKDAITNTWGTVSKRIVLEDGYTVTGFKVTPVFSKLPTGAEAVPDANKALNFKDVSLVRVGGYKVVNDPIEGGLLVNATKNYTATVDSVYDLDNYDSNGYAEKNGYIAVDRLPWYFRTNAGNKAGTTGAAGWGSNTMYFNMMFDETADPAKTYGFSIDMRKAVPNAESTQVKFRLTDGGGTVEKPGSYTVISSTQFQTFTTTYTPAAGTTGKLRVGVRRGPGPMNAPVDFDNLLVWEDTNKNGKCDAGERIIYDEDFNDTNKTYLGTESGKINMPLDQTMHLGVGKLTHRFEENYAKVSGSNCALSYTNINGASGVYTFSAKMQVPYHYYEDIRNESDWGPAGRIWARGDGNGEALFAANEHNVEIKFTLTPDDTSAPVEYKTVSTVVTNAWDDVAASVVIDEGYKLTAVTVTPTFTDLAKNAWGANNVALNFKNVNLTRVGGYVPFTGAIENGEFLTGADSNYTEVDTVYDLDVDNFENGKAVKNGYITTGRFPWYHNNTTWRSNNIVLFKQNAAITYTKGNQYGITFLARKSVPSNASVKVKAYFYGNGTGTPEMELTDEWKEYSAVWTAGDITGQHLNASINLTLNSMDTPIDIDNLTYWEDLNKNGVLDAGEPIAYSKDYNDPDATYIGVATDPNYIYTKFGGNSAEGQLAASNAIGAANINYIAYSNLAHEFEDNYAYGDVEYTNIKNAGEGVYTFTAEVELPYHYNYNMTTIPGTDRSVAAKYFNLNSHDVKVTFTIDTDAGEETKVITLDNAVEFGWNTIAASVVIAEGQSLKAVKAELVSNKLDDGTDVVPADKQILNFRNAWLTSEELPVVEAEADDDENYLDGIKPQYNDNTIPKDVKVTDPDGELYISERTTAEAYNEYNIFTITTGAKLAANRTYYVDYTVSAAAYCRIRVTVNSGVVSEKVADANGTKFDSPTGGFIIANDDSELKTVYYDNNAGTIWLHSDLTGGTEYSFKSHFTPTAENKNLVISFNRGDYGPNSKAALTIDDISVYYLDGNEKVYVYTNDFDTDGAIEGIKGNSKVGTAFTIEHILPLSHTLYSPVDDTQPMEVTYELGLTDDESVEGKYSFRAVAKLAEASDKDCKVRVSFNYDDGTSEIQYLDLSTNWGVIGKQGWLGKGTKLKSITIRMDADVSVMLMEPDLDIFYKYTYGKPNSGIVMVLIKKMQGKMTDPWKSVGVN